MMFPDLALITLVLITLFAATVNGALGYGFSSITIPVGLLFYTNRILNPAVVLIEVVINWYVLFINRESIPAIWKRVLPILLGVGPGILAGSYILFVAKPDVVKLLTYSILFPLILLQAAGIRRPIRSEKVVGASIGVGIGVIYSVTTISGPPLALLFNNQGFAKQDFRAAMAIVRVAESTLTAVAYTFLGLYSAESSTILFYILPSILIGIPLGTYIIQRVNAETFSRVCRSLDIWIISFGLSWVLTVLKVITSAMAYSLFLAVVVMDAHMLHRFFIRKKASSHGEQKAKTVIRRHPWEPL